MQGQAQRGETRGGGRGGGMCRARCLWAGKDRGERAARQNMFADAVKSVAEGGAGMRMGWSMDLRRLEALCQHVGLQLKGQVNTLSLPSHLHEAAVQPLICLHPIPAAKPHNLGCLETIGGR